MKSMKFGEFLVSRGIAHQEAIEEGLRVRRYTGARLGRTLRDLGHITQETLDQALSAFFTTLKLPSLDELIGRIIPRSASSHCWTSARRFGAVPLQDGTGVMFAVPRFRDDLLEEAERLMPGRDAKLVILAPEALAVLQSASHVNGEGGMTGKTPASRSAVLITRDESDDEKLGEDHPYTQLMREGITVAKGLKASDIHIEPTERGLAIRHRVHGELVTWKELAAEHRYPFIARIKRILNLDLAVVGRPQDSRASFAALKLDTRVNALPVIYGEKIVLRLLDWERSFDLAASGIEPDDTVEMLRRAVRHKEGLVVISGPTGSGKTTTLYALLATLDAGRLNICTLENPVEYRFAGINQVDVAPERGLSFATALRSLMRQDPDVILVGEIRDEETAALALQAAGTGHLVLSTLHANSADEAVDRLGHLGIKRSDLAGTLRLSAAQRLVRRLCPACSVPLDEGAPFPDGPVARGEKRTLRQRNLEGCAACQKGIAGRIAVLECLEEGALRTICAAENAAKPYHESFVPLREVAWSLATAGKIDAFEAATL